MPVHLSDANQALPLGQYFSKCQPSEPGVSHDCSGRLRRRVLHSHGCLLGKQTHTSAWERLTTVRSGLQRNRSRAANWALSNSRPRVPFASAVSQERSFPGSSGRAILIIAGLALPHGINFYSNRILTFLIHLIWSSNSLHVLKI